MEQSSVVDADLINQREWERDENWRGRLAVYYSVHDTRTLVPRRSPAQGTTLNFAHATAWFYLLGLGIVPLGFLLLLVIVSLSR